MPDTAGSDECLFCRVVAGDVPAKVVAETPDTIAFRDISPQAPVHVLVIPRTHYRDVAAMTAADPGLAGRLLADAAAAADAEGLSNGYRLVFNTGPDGMQSVLHVHGHLLGGRSLAWPPG